ncbi:hypothetical protein DPMN_096946 [Dreissena polymorpha]|uniref:Elongation factor G-like domain-containing protein n=1 Tax=Dreissena polymorpha TaxID=45954 RepID=A0A9D4LAV0_DREPO|nr:hypothetical protein DPMN_096946 [Dreissena polymorpha]
MDKHGANFNMCLKSIRERLHVQPIPIHLPIGKERDFVGLVDLVSLEQKIWDSSKCPDGSVYETEKLDLDNDSPSSRMVHNERDALIGILSEYDENIQTHVLNDVKNEDIPSSDIENAIRNITINNDAVIVLCGSAKRNIGVQPLLDAVVKYLPCPSDIKHNFLEYYGSNLCALTFKIVHDKHRGALTYVRVYQGVLKAGESIYNMNLNTVEKIGKQDLFQVNADEYRQVKEVGAGNIACVGGLNDVRPCNI